MLTEGKQDATIHFVTEGTETVPLHRKATIPNFKGGNKKMKKKLALLLAATMIVGMMPFSAFAGSVNRTSTVVTGSTDDFNQGATIIIENEDNDWLTATTGNFRFELSLTGAEWAKDKTTSEGIVVDDDAKDADIEAKILSGISFQDRDGLTINTPRVVGVDLVAAKRAVIEIAPNGVQELKKILVKLPVKLTDDGEAKVTVDRLDSPLSNGSYPFANVTSSSTTTTIEGSTDVSEAAKKIKPIIISESVRKSIEKNGTITLKLSNNFKFVDKGNGGDDGFKLTDTSYNGVTGTVTNFDDDELTIKLTAGATDSEKSRLVLNGIWVETLDDTKPGEIATITVSGAGVDKTKLEAAKYVDYGYVWEAEDKDLPVLYSGSYDMSDNDTLKVTFKETVKGSWLRGRKTTITFPDGVKVNDIDVKKSKNASSYFADYSVDGNKVTVSTTSENVDKAEVELVFNVSIDAGFTGDITATLGGAAVTGEMTAVVAKAEMPFKIETVINEVKIDYRNVAINDITIKEAYAGALEKSKTLRLTAEEMAFEKGVKAEVVEGDLTIDKIETDKDGNIDLKIDRESVNTPATIKVSGLQLYLNRSLPAGDYRLSATPVGQSTTTSYTDAFFKNYKESVDSAEDKAKATKKFFDTDEVVLIPDFVKVVTAPRDQDDSTFTTKLSVVIGAKEMKAGEKTIPLAVPAYISADGYTMLPVRAVTEALSGTAIVNWDNATRKVTIIFGSRIISMTIGSNTMTINGTEVPMSSKAVITEEYTFIPLRDLGYALGLSNDKIAWDAASKTATLN